MHDISPVLAGTWSQPQYAATNDAAKDAVQLTAATAATAVDPSALSASSSTVAVNTPSVDDRRYSKFDRTATNAGSTTDFSFGDFLDMINPLQHIPVVSSVYREIAGEKINPVSRVAGDILYGGAVGVASGILGCVGAAADTVAESETGKDKIGNIVASLLGTDVKASPATTQLASSADAATPTLNTGAPVMQVASAPLAGSASPSPVTSGSIPLAPMPAIASVATLASTTSTGDLASNANAKIGSSDTPSKLSQSKLAFGGVLAPTGTTQEQNMTMALASSSRGMRIGNTIYTSPMMNGRHPLPIASAPALPAAQAASLNPNPLPASQGSASQSAQAAQIAAASATPASLAATMSDPSTILANSAASISQSTAIATSSLGLSSGKSPMPASLNDNSLMLKALNQYRAVAGGSTSATSGSQFDIMN